MSVDYSIFIDSEEPIDVVKTKMEKVTCSSYKLNEEHKHSFGDIYYTEVLGLWLQFRDYRENRKRLFGEFPRHSYHFQIGYLRDITGLDRGKDWQRIAVVELAQMISRNLNCMSVVCRDHIVTHRYVQGSPQEIIGKEEFED